MKIRITAAAAIFLLTAAMIVPIKAQASGGLYGFAYNRIQFEKLSESAIPDALASIISSNKAKRGFAYYYDINTGYMYIAVLMGEKSTGGYAVEVTAVEDCEGRTNVLINEIVPAPGSVVTQAITYPYTVIRAKGITPNITVKSSSGTVYNNIQAVSSDTKNISYILVTEDSLRNSFPQIIDAVNKLKKDRGYYVFKGSKWGISDSSAYLLISAGMKPTLGYGIEVPEAEKKDKVDTITIRETSPDPGSIEGNIVTWPVVLLKIGIENENINVVSGTGKKLFPLSLDTDAAELDDIDFSVIKGYEAVAEDKAWTITFNSDIPEENINCSNIYIRDGSGKKIQMDFKPLDNKRQLVVVPRLNYVSKGTYYLFIMKSIGSMPINVDESKGYRMKFTVK